MKRFIAALILGLVIQALVVLFWIASSYFSWPPGVDYIVAPGSILLWLHQVAVDARRDAPIFIFVASFLINLAIYSSLAFLFLTFLSRRRSAKQNPGAAKETT